MRQQDDFGINMGASKTQRFCANLVKLAVAPALGALVAEHGAHVVQAASALVEQVVLNGGAHYASGGFGAQGQGFAVELVFKRVHFFFNHVGDFAQTAHE